MRDRSGRCCPGRRRWRRGRRCGHVRGQRVAAQMAVEGQPVRPQLVDLDRAFPVLELAAVEVARLPIHWRQSRHGPSRGRCRWSPASAAGRPPRADRGWSTRSGRARSSSTDASASLTWRNSGSCLVTPEQQSDPGPGAHASHAHHLAGKVGHGELLEQVGAAVYRRATPGKVESPPQQLQKITRPSGSGSSGGHVGSSRGHDQRRLVDDPCGCPSTMCVSLASADMLSRVRALATIFSPRWAFYGASSSAAISLQVAVGLEMGVPDPQGAHVRELPHREVW